MPRAIQKKYSFANANVFSLTVPPNMAINSSEKIRYNMHSTMPPAAESTTALPTPLCASSRLSAPRDMSARTATPQTLSCSRKGYDRQREHDSVCGVAVRAEICGVRDEDLVDNVIERRDEQGNHAGYRIFAHEPAELFLPEKGLIVIFHGCLLCKKIKGANPSGFTPLATR